MISFIKFILLNLFLKLSDSFELGIIPYALDEMYGNSVLEKTQEALKEIESQSCLKFIQVDRNATSLSNPRGLFFSNPKNIRECVHNADIGSDWVVVTFGYDCLERHQILHSILHGLGMSDEVSHPGRDQYVKVMWQNIAPEYRILYQLNANYVPRSVEYDPQSVMQFHDRAYSFNGNPTLEATIPGLRIEPSEHLSQLDALRLHLLFSKACDSRDVNDLIEVCKKTLYRDNDEKGDPKEDPADDNSAATIDVDPHLPRPGRLVIPYRMENI